MPKQSAGILLFRRRQGELEVLLVHPGGPFWKSKDRGVWSIPKGEYEPPEDPLAAARREFEEETGARLANGQFAHLGEIRQASGKVVTAWAAEGDCDADSIRGNTFAMEWPPKSGKLRQFPEVDRAEWFSLQAAREKLIASQHPFLDRLEQASRK